MAAASAGMATNMPSPRHIIASASTPNIIGSAGRLDAMAYAIAIGNSSNASRRVPPMRSAMMPPIGREAPAHASPAVM